MEISSNKLIAPIQKCTSSKSYANRALFLASFKASGTKIHNLPNSEDVDFFIKSLLDLGLRLTQDNDSITFETSFLEASPSKTKIYLGEGGTTIRFITVMLASVGGNFELEVEPRFLKRPLDDLKAVLAFGGVTLSIRDNCILLKGKLDKDKNYEINCSKTTQVASAFLMLEKLGRVESVKLFNLENSKKYIDMTKSMNFKEKYIVPVDFSSLSYFVVWGILNQDLMISNVRAKDELQADSFIFNIMDSLNIPYEFSPSGLKIYKSEVQGNLTVDCSQCLDLIPSLAFLFAYGKGDYQLINCQNLIYKESNRLEEILKALDTFNVSYHLKGNTLLIKGSDKLNDAKNVKCSYDHRIVMMNALFLKHNQGGQLEPEAAVAKSFKGFFEVFN